jgi:hypothetical protein
MAVTYPLAASAFWEQLRFANRPEFRPMFRDKQSEDAGGNTRTAFLGSPKWAADVALAGGRHNANMPGETDLHQMRMRSGTFLAYDIRRPYPASDPGGVFLDNGSVVALNGVAASGNVSGTAYTVEGQSVTQGQAVSVVGDAGAYFDADGILQTSAVNALRVDYGPLNNHGINHTFIGAVDGSPGTLPTGMSISAPSGLTRTISVETINGVKFMRVKFSGTASSAAMISITYASSALTRPRTVQNEVWNFSQFLQVVKGTGLAGNNWRMEFWEYDSASAFLGGSGSALSLSSTDVDVTPVRREYSRAVSSATVAYASPLFRTTSNIANGTVCDIEFLIGAPIISKGSSAPAYPRQPIGLLAETAFTNLITRSREFDHADWTKVNLSGVTANVSGLLSPWGALTVDKIVEAGGSAAAHGVAKSYSTTDYGPHVIYAFAKAGERTHIQLLMTDVSGQTAGAAFDLVAGTVGTVTSGTTDFTGAAASIKHVGGGYYWCELTATKVNTGDNDCWGYVYLHNGTSNFYAGDGTSGVYMAFAQMEKGSVGHMPAITTSATLARAMDSLTFRARGTNSWLIHHDNGWVGGVPSDADDWVVTGANLARPWVKDWTATRITSPPASTVQVKSKGSNNRSLALKGLPPFYRISKGDKLSILYSTTKRFLFEAVEDVTADIVGDTAEFEISPYMPPGITVNDAVTLKKPCGKFKPVAESYRGASGRGNISDGVSFSMVSVP